MKKRNPTEKQLPDLPTIVKLLLRDKRMTLTDLAKRAGMPLSTLSQLMKRRNWSVLQVKALGTILNTNLFVYFLPESTEGMVPAAMVQEMTSEILELKNKLSETEALVKQQQGEIAALERLIHSR